MRDRRFKIDDCCLPDIIARLQSGETFTSVGASYGVKAWTIQKRLKVYHPTGGRNTSAVWMIVPNYMIAVKMIARRYSFVDVNMYDITLDYAYRFTVNELNVIAASKRPFWKMHDILRSKVYTCHVKKKRQRVAGVECFVTAANALSTIVKCKFNIWD